MDRAALVTGGSSGIGLAIARMLRDEGYELTLASRRAERVQAAAEELGALAVAVDVGSAEDCARLVAEHQERYGRLDVLVNSAGTGVGGTVEDLPAKHFDLQIGVNLRGLFLVTQAAIPLLRETRGWIVNLASIAGTLPAPGLATYGATKAAVISLTHSLNEELDADALARGCDTLVSIGGVQSNHTRQVAAVAAHLGLKSVLVQEHWVDWDDPGYETVGNILLSRIMGADVRLSDAGFDIALRPSWEDALG